MLLNLTLEFCAGLKENLFWMSTKSLGFSNRKFDYKPKSDAIQHFSTQAQRIEQIDLFIWFDLWTSINKQYFIMNCNNSKLLHAHTLTHLFLRTKNCFSTCPSSRSFRGKRKISWDYSYQNSPQIFLMCRKIFTIDDSSETLINYVELMCGSRCIWILLHGRCHIFSPYLAAW